MHLYTAWGACVRARAHTHTHTHLNRFKYKYNITEQYDYESKLSVPNSSSYMQQFSLQNYHSKSVTLFVNGKKN